MMTDEEIEEFGREWDKAVAVRDALIPAMYQLTRAIEGTPGEHWWSKKISPDARQICWHLGNVEWGLRQGLKILEKP
jgi:hypothetical protein